MLLINDAHSGLDRHLLLIIACMSGSQSAQDGKQHWYQISVAAIDISMSIHSFIDLFVMGLVYLA